MPTVSQTPEEATYALLADGATVEIRPPGPEDAEAMRHLYAELTPESYYRRFFGSGARMAEQSAQRLCRVVPSPLAPTFYSLLALLRGKIVGIAEYDVVERDDGKVADEAEVAFTVAEGMRHRGIATLLLEHLVSAARRRGIRRFSAYTLMGNHAMLEVFADLGLRPSREVDGGVACLTIPLDDDEDYRGAVAAREHGAEVASLRHTFSPTSVVVVGASRTKGTVGRAILDNILGSGFTGDVYAVNPHAGQIGGIPCYASIDELPVTPELAVIAVPAVAAVEVAEACGRRGVQSLVVVTSGFDAETGPALLATCRRHGMRLVGPNCLGIAATDPAVRLDATFAAHPPAPGSVGLAVQSGGVGIAMLEHLSRLGIGVSTFASLGDKYDVSANDMLELWESDGRTRLGVLYVESFGSPRKFARTARRVSRRIPLLTVSAGRSAAGRRAAASHTAAVATATTSRDALFTQAGVIATRSLAELVAAATLLDCQPLPAGGRVAIVTNAGGAGVLAADACAEAGLTVPEFGERLREALAKVLPAGAASGNPVDATAAVAPGQMAACLEVLCAADEVDAVLVLLVPTALADLAPAVTSLAAWNTKPVLAVFADQPEAVRILRTDDGRRIPSYADPAAAAQALGHACRYVQWRRRDHGREPAIVETRPADAARILSDFLLRRPEGGWLPPEQVTALLSCYHMPMVASGFVSGEDEAAAAAAGLGYPVVLKASGPGLVHKSDAGGVILHLEGESELRGAYRRLVSTFGDELTGAIVQPMVPSGVEVLAGVTHDEVFGPLIVFGYGGVATEVFGDHVARLTPLTDVDAAEMVRRIRSAPLLFGYRGSAPTDIGGLEQLLLRLSRLADDHPRIAEIDLNPVIARADGLFVVDARVRVHERPDRDPYLRRLR